MAKRPLNMAWIGFTPEQIEELDLIDYLGNNGWSRNGQTDAVMVNILRTCENLGLSIEQIKEAMASIGYGPRALHMLDRWESKRITGKFGR